MDNAIGTLVFASGMAAIVTTFLTLLNLAITLFVAATSLEIPIA
jgi:cystathionine beta-lyase/cystathionine gamma-synthase